MRVFSILGAEHYCNQFQAIQTVARDSVEDLNRRQANNLRMIDEGSPLFDEYRACALRDSERALFLAASHYRRAIDLMVPSSIHWAHVTLYYGAWFAAHALLGMFGCHVLSRHIVEVERSSPGNQRLRRIPIGDRPNQFPLTRKGSHQRFWEAFYATTPHIIRFADAQYAQFLVPVSNNQMWLIDERNRVNYNSIESIGRRDSFVASFSAGSFPGSLPGQLNTQYAVCEGLIFVCHSFASQLQLATDALNSLGLQTSFQQRVKQHVYDPNTPNLVGQTTGQLVFG